MTTQVLWLYRVVEMDEDPLRIPPRPFKPEIEDAVHVPPLLDNVYTSDVIWKAYPVDSGAYHIEWPRKDSFACLAPHMGVT